jgi:hypothetical protein
MPRYVVLYHEPGDASERPAHWDLMLEYGNVLRTWAIETTPNLDETLHLQALPDHRLEYLEYEGPVSGNRGLVTRIMSGTYETVDDHWPTRWVVKLSEETDTLLLHLERIGLSNLWNARFEAT